MSATNAAQPRFKVGDRVRVTNWTWSKSLHPGTDLGTIFAALNDDECYAVDFPGWTSGHDADVPDGAQSRWWISERNIELAAAPAAKFQVVYIDEDDDTFDTQEAAEKCAAEYATANIGLRYGVFKLVAVASAPAVTVERV